MIENQMKQSMNRVKNILGDKKGDSMRNTMVLMTISSLLLSGAVVAVEGGKKAGASAATVKSRTFNVLNYGAEGDDKTDNTEAFSACLKAVIAAGGGKMFIPDGIYRGRIVIPGTKAWITVEIAGESEPTPVFGTIGAFPFPKNGTIIKCLSESGPAVISSASVPDKLYMQFSGINVSLRNLDVRTYDNPGIGGIDLLNAVQCKLENVFVNTDIYNVQASKLVCNGGAGIRARRIGSAPAGSK
jgi:polygalacturonase